MNIDFDKIWPSALGGVGGLALAWIGGIIRRGIGSETRAPVWKRFDEQREEQRKEVAELRKENAKLRERVAVLEANGESMAATLKSFGDKIDSIPEHVDRKLEAMEQRIISAFGKRP